MKLNFNRNPLYILIVLTLIFLVCKIYHLTLPFFWDEAWSYIPAIFKMYKTGPGLLPGSINPDLYRGHPLFFYFIASSWMKIFGSTIFSIKSFMLIISILLLFAVFYLGKILKNGWFGLIAASILMVQAVFVSQSAFVLPEILLSLFVVLTFIFYLKRKIWLEILFTTLALLTKETSVILAGSVILVTIIDFIDKKYIQKDLSIKYKSLFLDISIRAIPVLIFISFFVIQKIKLGWYFFPGHMELISLNKYEILYKFKLLYKYIFILQGRWVITYTGFITYIYLLIKKDNEIRIINRFAIKVIVLLALFLVFSSLNFFTNRYTLFVLPLFVITMLYPVYIIFNKYKIAGILMLIILFYFPVKYTVTVKTVADDNLGYIDAVKTDMQVINYCEQQQWENKKIMTHFLMMYNLTYPETGYLMDNTTGKFNIVYSLSNNPEIVIVSNIEQNEDLMKVRSSPEWKLIKRFGNDVKWSEIYEK